jgi:hypothetical protein
MKPSHFLTVFFALCLFSTESTKAQSPPPPPVTDVPNPIARLIPPSPNAAALGEYGRVPVGLFTGTVQQHIPLYTIETADFSFPITLDYQSNGIKVSDAGSDVGLGWTLSNAGVITRSLSDEPDEKNTVTRTSLPFTPNTTTLDNQTMRDFLATQDADTQDGEPDLFSFNFGNYSGKFYLTGPTESKQAVLISSAPLKFEFLSGFYTYNDYTSEQIKITDPAGIAYTFGGSNAVDWSASRQYYGSTSLYTPFVKTAWYLTKITLANGEEINFTYANNASLYTSGIFQVCSASISYADATHSYSEPASHTLPTALLVNSHAAMLSEINWKAGRLVCISSSRFTTSSPFKKVDELIIYTKHNTATSFLKKYSFNYLLATVNPLYTNPGSASIPITSGDDLDKRLFLKSLSIKSEANTELSKYTFDYFSETDMPHRLTYGVDYWGYFNGKYQNADLVTNDVSSYNPNYYGTGTQESFTRNQIISLFSGVGGNKAPDNTPNSDYAKKGLLQKITYPTGGYSILDYEPHSTGKNTYTLQTYTVESVPHTTPAIPYNHEIKIDPELSFGDVLTCDHGGRIVTLTFSVLDVQSNSFLTIRSDVNANLGQHPTAQNGSPVSYYASLEQGKTYTISIENITTDCTDFTADLKITYAPGAQSWVNTTIGGMRLSKVTTGDLMGNEQIKRYYYANDFSCLTCSNGVARTVEPAISYYANSLSDPSSGYTLTLTASLSDNNLHSLYDEQGNYITYPIVIEGEGNDFEGGATLHKFSVVPETQDPNLRDPIVGAPYNNAFGNGDEFNTIYYKNNKVNNANSFVKVREINNTYLNDSRLASIVKGFRYVKRYFHPLGPVYKYNLNTYTYRSKWRYLSERTEMTYDQNGYTPFTVYTIYNYNNEYHMQVTEIDQEKSGGSQPHSLDITVSTYPSDYDVTTSSTGVAAVMKTMNDRHILSTPVEMYKYTATGITANYSNEALYTYKMNGNSVVKDKDFKIRSEYSSSYNYEEPVNFVPSSISNNQLVYDSHYEQLNAYDGYDAACNLNQLTDRKGTYSLIVEPISENTWAKTDHSKYGNIAYSSFEHSTASNFTNWIYNISAITNSVSLNGTRAYNLTGNSITNLTQLDPVKNYKISFWKSTSAGNTPTVIGAAGITLRAGPVRNGWQYFEGTFTGSATVQISGNAIIDELRLYPTDDRMTTYVYKDGVGVISECNGNNQCTFWEYDEFNRLQYVKDQDGNVLKKNEYKYQYSQP